MFFRKKKHDHEPMPPWVKWALIVFLGIAFIGNLRNKHDANAPKSIPQVLGAAADNLSPHKLLPIDTYKNTIFPRYGTTLRIKELAPGEGTPAVCGQQVKIAYESYGEDKKPIEAGQTLAFRIGEGKIMPALEQGVVGMKKGGKRSLISPPNMAYGSKESSRQDVTPNTPTRFEIELQDATPAIPDAAVAPYRIAIITPGSGPVLTCGEPGKFQVSIWSTDGKKLFSTKDNGQPITITPGKSEVFFGLEQGVLGIRRGGMFTLVVPPAFLKTMNSNPSATDFHLPNDQTVLVDVEAIP